MSQNSEKDFIDLIEEAINEFPNVKYGNMYAAVHSGDIISWFWDWIPRAQRALDDHEGCDKCELLNNRLHDIEYQLGIYDKPLTIEMEIQSLHYQIARLKNE